MPSPVYEEDISGLFTTDMHYYHIYLIMDHLIFLSLEYVSCILGFQITRFFSDFLHLNDSKTLK